MRLARPPMVDVLVASAFVVLVAAEAALSSGVRSPALHLVIAGLAMASLAWRRSAPVPVAALVMASNLTVNPEGQFSTLLAMVLVAFTCGAETDPPWSWVGLGVVVVPFLAFLAMDDLEPSDVAAALVFLAGPWAVGTAMRRRVAHAAEVEARARQLERDREAHVAAAAAAERTRIARELHDIVSHSLSVITIQTQAVRRRLGPEQAREVEDLAAVEGAARDALAEMRRLFGVLRSDGESASLSPQPGLDELARLCEQVRAAGLAVEVRIDGEPSPLPPGLDLAAYRIVQEGLTNALRHARAGRATVELAYDPGRIGIVVEDDGRGFDPDLEEGDGHGLVGVRERVALYSGTLQVLPGDGRGTRLVASLPFAEGR